MSNLGTSTRPALLNDLPAFFQEDIASDPCHPVKALLQVFEDNLHSIEQRIETCDRLLDPETIPGLDSGPKETQFLHWLASWVALELDQDWFDPSDDSQGDQQPRHRRAVELIRDAAQLYRQRGTPHGFKSILERFHGRQVEVLECSWPQGGQLDFSSCIGVDFWLLGDPKPQDAFVLVIHPTQSDIEAVGTGIFTVESDIGGELEPRKIVWLLSRQAAEESGSPRVSDLGATGLERQPVAGINDAWTSKVDRVRATVAKEKPAHTCCFLAVPSFSQEAAKPELGPLIIAVHSTIEQFRIE